MNSPTKLLILFVILFVVAECAPRRGGGGGGKSNSSAGGKRSQGGYYLHGGLYPVGRSTKEAASPKPQPVSRRLSAWGIIGIVLSVLALCSGTYYALYLCDRCHRTSNYQSNISAQNLELMNEKPKPEENGNGNIPMVDQNELAKLGSAKNGLNEVFL